MTDDLDRQTKNFIYPLDSKTFNIIKETPFNKVAQTNSSNFLVNVHYLPYWKLFINGKEVTPTKLDKLARPIIQGDSSMKTVELDFKQTNVEVLANFLSILGIIVSASIPYLLKKNISDKEA